MRSSSLVAITVLAVLGAGTVVGSAVAREKAQAYSLHIRGHAGSPGHLLDIDLPWEPDHGGSPFDFTSDACDGVQVDRLRRAWNVLRKVPEGRTVTIETDSESIRASRWAGYLVLEPLRGDDFDEHHSRIEIPDYIVQTVLDHDGRLSDRDVERLLQQHGKVTLVKVNSDQGGVVVWMDRTRREPD